MSSFYEMSVFIDAKDTDCAERWMLSATLSAMQNAGDRHAIELGVGKKDLESQGFNWVIARLRVDLQRSPKYGDTITVRTWPGEATRIGFPRFFRFLDADGAVLGTATTLYILIDDRHRPCNTDRLDIYKTLSLLPDTNPMPTRVRMKERSRAAADRTVCYSDIDLNGHMNNTRYAQWVCDLFPTAQFRDAFIGAFQINYISDGIEGHAIALDVFEDAGGFVARGTDRVTDAVVFESQGSWVRP